MTDTKPTPGAMRAVQADHCPKCGSDDLEWGNADLEGEYCNRDASCQECGLDFVQHEYQVATEQSDKATGQVWTLPVTQTTIALLPELIQGLESIVRQHRPGTCAMAADIARSLLARVKGRKGEKG